MTWVTALILSRLYTMWSDMDIRTGHDNRGVAHWLMGFGLGCYSLYLWCVS